MGQCKEDIHIPSNAKELSQLVNQGEGSQLEFKRKLPGTMKTAKLISAFANTMGGLILVGVTDNKRYHQIHLGTEIQVLSDACSMLHPPPEIHWETLPIDTGKKILIIKVLVCESSLKVHAPFRSFYSLRIFDESLVCPRDFEKTLTSQVSPIEELDEKELFVLKTLIKLKGMTLKEVSKKLNWGQKRTQKLLIELLEKGHVFRQRRGLKLHYYPFRYQGLWQLLVIIHLYL